MIWGYAENGVGFIVGCISTLRPLFRKMFQLGGSDSSVGHLGGPSGELDNRDGLAYNRDPNAFGGRERGDMKTDVTTSQLGRKLSGDSGSTSEEYILQDITGVDRRHDVRGIQVQRSVHQTID